LRALAGLERPAAGEVWIAGQRTAHLRSRARRHLIARQIGFVHQRPAENLLEYLSVSKHVSLAWKMRAGVVDHEGCDTLVDMTDLAPARTRRPHGLSAGQQQRLAFAMAVAADPTIVIADEPTAELDGSETESLVTMMPRLAALGRTFVLTSHDPAVLAIADKVLVMRAGSLVAEFPSGGDFLALVDSAGRVPLPDEALQLFPEGRANLFVDDVEVRLRRP